MRKIIGICGKKKHGKDAVAKILIDKYHFTKYSFADPLKRGVQEMFGLTDEQCWGDQSVKETVDERWGISPRKLLQLVGTDIFREYLPSIHKGFGKKIKNNIWVNRFKIWVEENPDMNIIVPDVRFLNEIKAIKNIGGDIWHIDAGQRVGTDGDSHKSENEWCQYDFNSVIDNNGTMEELYNNVEEMLGVIL